MFSVVVVVVRVYVRRGTAGFYHSSTINIVVGYHYTMRCDADDDDDIIVELDSEQCQRLWQIHFALSNEWQFEWSHWHNENEICPYFRPTVCMQTSGRWIIEIDLSIHIHCRKWITIFLFLFLFSHFNEMLCQISMITAALRPVLEKSLIRVFHRKFIFQWKKRLFNSFWNSQKKPSTSPSDQLEGENFQICHRKVYSNFYFLFL